MNGRHSAKDIISAADYISALVNKNNNLSKTSAIDLIESKSEASENMYTDLEGFAAGTFSDLIDEIKPLSENR